MGFDPKIALASALVGVVVGLTGMGGGALLTPILVLFFGVDPLVAVSSDLVVSLVVKPIGAAVHLSKGTVHRGIVRDLALGSVPAAFTGVLLLKLFPSAEAVSSFIQIALGVALLLAVGGLLLRGALELRRGGALAHIRPERSRTPITIAVGVLGGLIVGMTSVGSGSLMIVLLMFLYPGLTTAELVGTDLTQAIPLIASAAFGHLLFGKAQLGLTTSLLVGAIPAVYFGAKLSIRAPGQLIRRVLLIVLLASALKLLSVPNEWMGPGVLLAIIVVAGAHFALRPRSQPVASPEGATDA